MPLDALSLGEFISLRFHSLNPCTPYDSFESFQPCSRTWIRARVANMIAFHEDPLIIESAYKVIFLYSLTQCCLTPAFRQGDWNSVALCKWCCVLGPDFLILNDTMRTLRPIGMTSRREDFPSSLHLNLPLDGP